MKRRCWLLSLFTGALWAQAKPQSPKKLKKFYVTGLYHTKDFNDCTLPPLVCYGDDRLSALLSLGLTVWSEEEYRKMVLDRNWERTCRAAK